MAVIVIGGQSREVGKTSLAAELIAAMPDMQWTAVKITQFGHGMCSVNGKSCGCGAGVHVFDISEERDPASGTDTSRFLAAGARRSLWVRAKQGRISEAIPALLGELRNERNVMMESNSILHFLKPHLYISMLDGSRADFKASAREFLDRADAVVLRNPKRGSQDWGETPAFEITPPPYATAELVNFVKSRLRVSSTDYRVQLNTRH